MQLNYSASRPPNSLPADKKILKGLIQLCSNKNVKIDDFCSHLIQDPITSLELLKRANSLEFGVSRIPITSVQNAIQRLGWKEVDDLIQDLYHTEDLKLKSNKWVEYYRYKCKKSAMVAKLIADFSLTESSQLAQLSALFIYLGDMLAAMQLGLTYSNLAENQPRSRVNYRLATDYGFDTENCCIDYLKRNGVPTIIIDIIDRQSQQKEVVRHNLRPVVYSATEIIEAYDCGKLNRYMSHESLPSGSQLRLLKLSSSSYSKLSEKISSYLTTESAIRESLENSLKAQDGVVQESLEPKIDNFKTSNSWPQTEEKNKSIINQDRLNKFKKIVEKKIDTTAPDASTEQTRSSLTLQKSSNSNELEEKFSITNSVAIRTQARSAVVFSDIEEPLKYPKEELSSRHLSALKVFEIAKDSEQLIALLLTVLTRQGFQKSAILVVSHDRTEALVIAARGNIQPGLRIKLDPTTSPIANGISKVQSSSDPSQLFPILDSSTYAVSPIKANHVTPVCLYADCGKDQVINFDTRRFFRSAVNCINSLMPRLPGGLLVEIADFGN